MAMTVSGMQSWRGRLVAVVACAAVGCGLGGCGAEQKNRPLSYQPGVYQGEKMPELGADDLKKLQERGTLQR